MLPYDRETQWFFKSLKRRNLLFIGQKHSVKHIIAKNRTKKQKQKRQPAGCLFYARKQVVFNEVPNYCSCASCLSRVA